MRLQCLDSSLVGRPQAKLYKKNPTYPGLMYINHQPKFGYYAVEISTLLSKQTVFQVAQGNPYLITGAATPINLSNWHTNLVGNGGLLPNPERLYVKNIAGFIDQNTMEVDAKAFTRNTLVTFFIGSNSGPQGYWQSHFNKIPGAGGLYSGSSGNLSNGYPEVHNEIAFWSPSYQLGTNPNVPNAPGNSGLGNPAAAMTDPVTGQMLTTRGVEIIEQGQMFGVILDPTLINDALGVISYMTNAGGIGINVWIYLDALWMRAVQ